MKPASICLCIHTILSSFQKIWETEGHLHSRSDPIHPCLQWKSRLYFTPHPNLPRLTVSHFLVTKGGFTRDRKGLVFIRFQRYPQPPPCGEEQTTAYPIPSPSHTRPSFPSCPPPTLTHCQPTVSLGVRGRVILFPQKLPQHLLCLL